MAAAREGGLILKFCDEKHIKTGRRLIGCASGAAPLVATIGHWSCRCAGLAVVRFRLLPL